MEGFRNARQKVLFQGCDGLRDLKCFADEETDAMYVFVPNMVIDVEGDLGWVTNAGHGGDQAPDQSGRLVPIELWSGRIDGKGNLRTP
jgi:hypothetical protein